MEEVSYAVREVAVFDSIKSALRMTSELIFLSGIEKVMEAGIFLQDTFTPVNTLVNPWKKDTISNASTFIENDELP